MITIVSKTIGEGWKEAVTRTLLEGSDIKDGDMALKELLNVAITIEMPALEDKILQEKTDPKMISWMRDNFFKLEPVENWGYSYGQRFFDYSGVNQIEEVIKKLVKNPDSKSATISLMNPIGDRQHMPCITVMDFKIRNGKLMTTTFFRSQDVGKKFYANAICLAKISKQVAERTGVSLGELNMIVASLHAYESDWKKVRELFDLQ